MVHGVNFLKQGHLQNKAISIFPSGNWNRQRAPNAVPLLKFKNVSSPFVWGTPLYPRVAWMCQLVTDALFRGLQIHSWAPSGSQKCFLRLIIDHLHYSFELAANISPGHFQIKKKSGFLASFEKACRSGITRLASPPGSSTGWSGAEGPPADRASALQQPPPPATVSTVLLCQPPFSPGLLWISCTCPLRMCGLLLCNTCLSLSDTRGQSTLQRAA